MLRRWWAGEQVSAEFAGARFDEVAVYPRPLQDPLEIWLGGKAPEALDRVARLADGWLTSALRPDEAGDARRQIEALATQHDRKVDPEHFGISIPYAREAPEERDLELMRSRRDDRDVTDIVPVGEEGLRSLVRAHIDGGLSKFVVRPVGTFRDDVAWRDELRWLAEAVLPLQT